MPYLRKFVFFLLLALFSFAHHCLAQSPPVAGLDSNNVTITLPPNQHDFWIHVPVTATGQIDSTKYRLYSPIGQLIMQSAVAGTSPTFSYIYSTPYAPHTLKLTQIVKNAFGTDTLSISILISCAVVSPPISYSMVTSISGGLISAYCQSTDFCGDHDIQISGPYLTSSGTHTQISSGQDTVSLPGPVTVCGYFYQCTCHFGIFSTCNTLNVPCWRAPVVSFTHVQNGWTAGFSSNVIATNGANYTWDFGDGGTSVAGSPTHTYASPGTYHPCLTVTDTCGTTTYCDSLGIAIVGIEAAVTPTMTVIQQAGSDLLKLHLRDMQLAEATLQLLDLSGHTLMQQSLDIPATEFQTQVRVNVAAGCYLLRLSQGTENVISRKVYLR
jgi:PKD domain